MTDAGPIFEIDRSALADTGVDDVELLFEDTGSVVVAEIVAVFSTGSGVV